MRQLSPPHRACENGPPRKRETFIDDPASHVHGRHRCISRGAIHLPRRRRRAVEVHSPVGPDDPRSHRHDCLYSAQPRDDGVRHAVRDGQRLQDAAADAGRLHRRGGRPALEADPARRPALARRRARAGARLCRLDPPLGGARRHRQPADGAHRRTGRARRQDDPVPPEETVPDPALRTWQDLHADLRDDAGAPGQHRPVQAGQ